MALPWVQIVQWVPSILEVSRQVLQETRKRPVGSEVAAADALPAELSARIAALEANERRLAEVIHQMAEHSGALTEAMTGLTRQLRWLFVGQAVLIIVVVVTAIAV